MSVSVRRIPGPGAKQLEALIKGMGDKQGKVGWFSESKYENGTPVAYVAAIQEFGSPQNSIPPRSFMRTTIMEKRRSWAGIIGKFSKAVLSGAMSGDLALEQFVQVAKGDVQKKIASITDPALSPITLALRKVKMGQVPGFGREVTGRTVGIVAAMLKENLIDIGGVPDKPLIEPASIPGGGTLYTSIDSKVE